MFEKTTDEYGRPINDFQLFHNAYRRRCNSWRSARRRPRPHPGKKATRAAKRAKVARMKAAGHLRGDNRPYVEGHIYL